MKKKLTMLLLALVMAIGGGTSAALLTGCGGSDGPGNGQNTTDEYTVKFVDESGKVVKETTVKSGETVAAEAIPEKAGYSAKWVDATGAAVDFTKGITANVEYKIQYTAKTDTKYTVEHWYENLDGEYVKDATKTEEKTGTTDATVMAEAKSEAHYEEATGVGEVKSGTVAGDGSLVLKVYYKLETMTVTFEADGAVIDTQEVKYGGKAVPTSKEVPAKDKTDTIEFYFVRWESNGVAYNFDSEITENVTLVAAYAQRARHYSLDVQLYVSNMYFLGMNEENDPWIDDEEFKPADIVCNTEFTFNVVVSEEAVGTPVVTVIKYNDNNEQISSETVTPDEGGFYTVVINKNTKLEISGLTAKTYSVYAPISLAKYEVDWAQNIKAEDVILEVTDKNGNKTYPENAVTAPAALTKGVYTAAVVKADGNHLVFSNSPRTTDR